MVMSVPLYVYDQLIEQKEKTVNKMFHICEVYSITQA